jgi:hypothetical protein
MDLSTYFTARSNYEAAKAALDLAEKEICSSIRHKREGVTSHDIDGYKITITGRINRKIDGIIWEVIKEKIPENLRPIKYKPEIDLKGLRYLIDSEPEVYQVFSECLTATPGKPSLSITKKGE